MIVRAYGHATTETLLATPWKDFLKALSQLFSTASPAKGLEEQMDFRRNPRVFLAWRVERCKNPVSR